MCHNYVNTHLLWHHSHGLLWDVLYWVSLWHLLWVLLGDGRHVWENLLGCYRLLVLWEAASKLWHHLRHDLWHDLGLVAEGRLWLWLCLLR